MPAPDRGVIAAIQYANPKPEREASYNLAGIQFQFPITDALQDGNQITLSFLIEEIEKILALPPIWSINI